MTRRSLVTAAFAVAVVMTLVGCGSGSPPDAPSGVPCSPAQPPDEGTTEHRITSEGTERSYVLHVPPGYDGRTRLPVIVLLHGVGDEPRNLLEATGMDELADDEEVIVVAPEGSGVVPAWNFRATSDDPPSDVAYVHELLDRVKDTICVDDRRVYAAGFSNGSTLTLALACEDSRDFAAFGAVSGQYYDPRCDSAPPRPIIYFHGADDPVIPYSGAETIIGELPGVTEALTDWAEHNRCDLLPSTSQVSPQVTLSQWEGCAAGSEVSAYLLAGESHSWPGAPGWSNSNEIRATELMWKFFSEHALLP